MFTSDHITFAIYTKIIIYSFNNNEYFTETLRITKENNEL